MLPPISSSLNARCIFTCVILLFFHSVIDLAGVVPVRAESTATLRGRIVDSDGAVVPGAKIIVTNREIGVERFAQTDAEGNYQVAALPVGTYRIEVQAEGFQTQIVQKVIVEVGRTIVQDFSLTVGNISQEVTVTAGAQLVERSTAYVGHVIGGRLVQEVPLNGRYFLDLGLLGPGSVTPPQNGASTAPIRGSGSFAVNTAGNREESVNYLVNGITLNSQWFNSINFQPSISSVQEFKVDNSTFSAEYGRAPAPSSILQRAPALTNSMASCLNSCAMTLLMPATSSSLLPEIRLLSSATSRAAIWVARSSRTRPSSSSRMRVCGNARGSA